MHDEPGLAHDNTIIPVWGKGFARAGPLVFPKLRRNRAFHPSACRTGCNAPFSGGFQVQYRPGLLEIEVRPFSVRGYSIEYGPSGVLGGLISRWDAVLAALRPAHGGECRWGSGTVDAPVFPMMTRPFATARSRASSYPGAACISGTATYNHSRRLYWSAISGSRRRLTRLRRQRSI